jgi:hypothetical protein
VTLLDQTDRPNEYILREVDGWAYHATVLGEESGEVRTLNLDRPVALEKRIELVKDLSQSLGVLPPIVFTLFERYLSPREPYQSSPLSYLNAYGRSWSLWAENDRLEWAEFGAPDGRSGPLEFWFRNVVAGSTALVSISVTAGTTGAGVTGTFEVRSSAAAPNTISVTGFRDNLVDVVVRPDNPFGSL